MITYLLPTRGRPEALATTLAALGRLSAGDHDVAGGGEVIVLDNASDPPARVPRRLANGLPVSLIRLSRNLGAAARNLGARAARGDWLVMLDDDSHPVDARLIQVAAEAPSDVAAIGGAIRLPGGGHEAGGLPEVFVGCGALVRRDAFLAVGGYDESFGYFAEEYDLCAKLIRAGGRIGHDWRFRVRHLRDPAGRDVRTMLRHLVRNNVWAMQRYAPAASRDTMIRHTIDRYRGIALREHALDGWRRGLDDLEASPIEQPERSLSDEQWRRFTGRAAAEQGLADCAGRRVAVVGRGKNVEVVLDTLHDLEAELVEPAAAGTIVIGTLSPGPMLDRCAAWAARHDDVRMPWHPAHAPVGACGRPASMPVA